MTSHTTQSQTFKGTVVRVASAQTAVVAVSRYVKHPKYKKYHVRTKKYLVHDPESKARVGEAVVIRSCRPISKHKHFVIA